MENQNGQALGGQPETANFTNCTTTNPDTTPSGEANAPAALAENQASPAETPKEEVSAGAGELAE